MNLFPPHDRPTLIWNSFDEVSDHVPTGKSVALQGLSQTRGIAGKV